jgi:RES domain-containing protein
MVIYRIANGQYRDDISGYGASLFGGRWNSKGNAILYCTQHISLAVLELLVNFDKADSPVIPQYYLLEVEIPDVKKIILRIEDLKKDWADDMHYSQYIGDEFINDNSHLVLQIPSSVIPEEHNYLINPKHKDFSKIKILKTKKYHIDGRLKR